MQRVIKLLSVVAIVLLVFLAMGPANWQPRSGLGWELDHFVGYFAFTLMFCLAWPRPRVVGGALLVLAVLLEVLQGLTPDRFPDLEAALYSAGGVLGAALFFDLLVRAPRRLNPRTVLVPLRFSPHWVARKIAYAASRRTLFL